MEYKEITKTQFRDEYNVVKVLTDKVEIMKQLETFNSKNQAVAFGIRKQHRVTLDEKLDLIMNEIREIKKQHKAELEAIILEMRNNFKQTKIEIKNIKNEIKGINARLDKHDEVFKQHGWI